MHFTVCPVRRLSRKNSVFIHMKNLKIQHIRAEDIFIARNIKLLKTILFSTTAHGRVGRQSMVFHIISSTMRH